MTTFTQSRRTWITVSEQPLLAGAIIGLLTLAISVFLAILHPPVPVLHDEFSYLLAADTFMHGRLANPPHPMWVFFESYQINMLPTYVSKYPPMQGFALAFGRLISGQAIVGVWISLVAACVAVYWMLRGWLTSGWAFLGGLMMPLNGMVIYSWGLSFWGGAMAMLGGALLYGAIVRLVKRPRVLESVLCGVGIGILAMSRPYEGLVASIPAAGYLFYGMFRNKEFTWGRKLSAIVLPIGLILILTAGFMGYYNYRTTGNVTKFAYTVNNETYLPSPLFFFMGAVPIPEYRHDIMKRAYYDFELARYEFAKTFSGFINIQKENFKGYWKFYFPSLLPVFLFGVPFSLRDRKFQFSVLCFLFFGLSLALLLPAFPHYAAPFAAVIVLVIIKGVQPLWRWEFRGWKIGNAVVSAILVISMVGSYRNGASFIKYRDNFFNRYRDFIARELTGKGGSHLVFVRYSQFHNLHDEWVWNGADIDGQQIVWARDMNKSANETLIDYYKNRQVWLLETDYIPRDIPSALKPYPR
ncbi:MAG: hypothetical protein ACE5EN_11520 [Nitrospinota bacterium]